ncbi:MAG: hypothetical protein M1548_01895 [Actinobacteria bacterium]|nr:hypothetical protein [Actinomycetota bacterium]
MAIAIILAIIEGTLRTPAITSIIPTVNMRQKAETTTYVPICCLMGRSKFLKLNERFKIKWQQVPRIKDTAEAIGRYTLRYRRIAKLPASMAKDKPPTNRYLVKPLGNLPK